MNIVRVLLLPIIIYFFKMDVCLKFLHIGALQKNGHRPRFVTGERYFLAKKKKKKNEREGCGKFYPQRCFSIIFLKKRK